MSSTSTSTSENKIWKITVDARTSYLQLSESNGKHRRWRKCSHKIMNVTHETLYKPRKISDKWHIHQNTRNELDSKLRNICYNLAFSTHKNKFTPHIIPYRTDDIKILTVTIYNIRAEYKPSTHFVGSDEHSSD
jgi:hypothetical protein